MSLARVRADPARPLRAQPGLGHNRWHWELEPALSVTPGEAFVLETIDASDAAVPASAPDAPWPAGRIHPLTGPVHVDGAEPGDVLEVEILDATSANTGVSGVAPGEGLLGHLIEEPAFFAWEIADGYARCDALPGVSLPSGIFPGVIGVAPSEALAARARRREEDLRERGATVADPTPSDAWPAGVADGLRTLPPRENGGNLDVRGLTVGGRFLTRVHVAGGLLSIGDMHLCQGDGELGASAIEIAGSLTLRCTVHRDAAWVPRSPVVIPAPERDRPRFMTVGLSVSDDRGNEEMDLMLAARNAAWELLEWVMARRGFTPAQAYVLLSVAADLRIAQLVNNPTPTVCASLPLDVFDDMPGTVTGADILGRA